MNREAIRVVGEGFIEIGRNLIALANRNRAVDDREQGQEANREPEGQEMDQEVDQEMDHEVIRRRPRRLAEDVVISAKLDFGWRNLLPLAYQFKLTRYCYHNVEIDQDRRNFRCKCEEDENPPEVTRFMKGLLLLRHAQRHHLDGMIAIVEDFVNQLVFDWTVVMHGEQFYNCMICLNHPHLCDRNRVEMQVLFEHNNDSQDEFKEHLQKHFEDGETLRIASEMCNN